MNERDEIEERFGDGTLAEMGFQLSVRDPEWERRQERRDARAEKKSAEGSRQYVRAEAADPDICRNRLDVELALRRFSLDQVKLRPGKPAAADLPAREALAAAVYLVRAGQDAYAHAVFEPVSECDGGRFHENDLTAAAPALEVIANVLGVTRETAMQLERRGAEIVQREQTDRVREGEEAYRQERLKQAPELGQDEPPAEWEAA